MSALRLLPVLALAALLGGCALLSPPAAEPQKSVLNQLPEAVPHATRPGGAIRVLPMTASAAYDTEHMAYSEQKQALAYYRDHEWAEPPQQMIGNILVRTVEQSGAFREVLTDPEATSAAYTLRSDLIELLQDETAAAPVLRLRLHFELSNTAGRAVIGRDIELAEPMAAKTPEAGVAAANAAAAKAAQEIAAAVIAGAR